MSLKQEMISGVFYTSISKYAGIVVMLGVTAILSRLIAPEEFGIVAIATVLIAFFAIFSDLGIGPAIIQHKELTTKDLDNIFSLTVWAGIGISLLFFAAASPTASFYDATQTERAGLLRDICRILSVNLLFASLNIVPNALIMSDKRFRFAAMRSLAVQVVGGAAAIGAAYGGAGIYALTINPVFSSILLFVINYRQHPLRLRLCPARESLLKVFSFSAYQFSFQLINYFSRNLDKLLMGRYMSLTELGYYDKSYRLMMLPLQNITYVVSPVMHPIFAHMQNDLRQLATSYLKVVRLLAFIGLPMAVVLCCTSRELVLIIFGSQWEASIPALRILSLSVGIQVILSTSGAIFQAANATKMLFWTGLLSTILNVAAICTGIFIFDSMEGVAWSICTSFLLNFILCYYLLFRRTLCAAWGAFWRTLLSPLALTLLISLPVGAMALWLPSTTPLTVSLAAKVITAGVIWLGYIHLRGEYALREELRHLMGKNR